MTRMRTRKGRHRNRRRGMRLNVMWLCPILIWFEQTMAQLSKHPTKHMHEVRAEHWMRRWNAELRRREHDGHFA